MSQMVHEQTLVNCTIPYKMAALTVVKDWWLIIVIKGIVQNSVTHS